MMSKGITKKIMNIFIFTHLKQWCALKLQLWNQLEKITAVNGSVEIGYFPLTISLLGSTTFHNLTSLEFRFLSSTSYELQLAARRDHRPLMESLIDNLENVPALKIFLWALQHSAYMIWTRSITIHQIYKNSLWEC